MESWNADLYRALMARVREMDWKGRIVSLDLETLVRGKGQFLTGERIIAYSMSIAGDRTEDRVYVADSDDDASEMALLRELDRDFGKYRPMVLTGYNISGYDIPLLNLKMRNLSFENQLWNVKYTISTAFCLDAMYVIADDLYRFDGDWHIRKLRDVISHEAYAGLNLMRKKQNVMMEGLDVSAAIERLWREDRERFREYCAGDSHDVMEIVKEIFSLR
ncbi:hypothetical protein GCM10007108_10650 [Thermogymnomonas acidicola]|uniref:Uncharacterized protein n=1 Tax=Thermogymnomonas acidicola TaxID=399579 RepID=A0AA37F9I5_9ARCH|nr:3'-5' exonuclease [Thermogymnomonas acidicola]GGM74578.1 hypothetical protein GCM10007108_10650 [Thermogymnomonas acidicola]